MTLIFMQYKEGLDPRKKRVRYFALVCSIYQRGRMGLKDRKTKVNKI